MIRDITLGQYYQTDSLIHRLDPRVKFIGTIVFIVSLFLSENFIVFGLAMLFLIAVIVASRVPFRYMVKGMKPILFLLIFTALMNLFLESGDVLVKFWIFKITRQGIRRAILMILRLTMLVIGSSLMTLTTTPTQLTDALESVFGFLKIIKVPVHEMAMMMSIALRFIPILLEETDRIMKAQQARGADFENGNLLKRVKNLIPILVPLFVSAFRRANDLAMAMEARCYRGGKGRTKMKPLRYGLNDLSAYCSLAAFLLCAIAIKIALPFGCLR